MSDLLLAWSSWRTRRPQPPGEAIQQFGMSPRHARPKIMLGASGYSVAARASHEM